MWYSVPPFWTGFGGTHYPPFKKLPPYIYFGGIIYPMEIFKRHFKWGMGDNYSSLLIRLPKPVSRVLNHLHNNCDGKNYVVTTHATIANELSMDRATVSKYMKKLLENKHIRKTDTPKAYQVSPDYFYAESEESRQDELDKHWRYTDERLL